MVRIAVVNDDTDFLMLMSELLQERDWEVIVHREADTAYQQIKRDLPDVIILDVRMNSPETGWQILELLTLDPETASTPVIVCSAALDDLRDKEDWLEQHGISILPKPFDIDDLYRRVDEALAGRASLPGSSPSLLDG